MRITDENKDSLDKIHLLSGQKKKVVRDFFESLATLIILDYLNGESTNIPFFGTFTVKQKGNTMVDGKKEACVEILFKPEDSFVRNIGQIEDGQDCDIIEICKHKIQNTLMNTMS